MYHVPKGGVWDSEAIAQALRDSGLDASVEEDRVLVALPGPDPLTIALVYRPDRFIRNVDIVCDPMQATRYLRWLPTITRAMKMQGYWVDDDRQIAGRYCPDSSESTLLFDRLDELQAEKERLIERQDFMGAARLRDEGYAVREKIDAILSAWANR